MSHFSDSLYNRMSTRIGMFLDKSEGLGKDEFWANMTEEWVNEYRAMWIPDADIPDIKRMASRVRIFFWWKKALPIMRAYWKGDKEEFHTDVKQYFSSNSTVDFRAEDLEMTFDQMLSEKPVGKTGTIKEWIKDRFVSLLADKSGIEELRKFIIKATYRFYASRGSILKGDEVLKLLYEEPVK